MVGDALKIYASTSNYEASRSGSSLLPLSTGVEKWLSVLAPHSRHGYKRLGVRLPSS